ncbi:hypothetical protein BH18ACT14_BH18ACT14_18260 [soil metagenome]
MSIKPGSGCPVPRLCTLAGLSYLDERLREPDELELDVGGLRRKQVHAYWDGCAYVV